MYAFRRYYWTFLNVMEKGGGGLQQNLIVLIRVIFQTDWRPFTVFLIMLHERFRTRK